MLCALILAVIKQIICERLEHWWAPLQREKKVLCLQLFNDIEELQYTLNRNTITNCRVEQQKTYLYGQYFEMEALD